MLVGARHEEHVAALLPMESGDRVGRYRFIGMADMRPAIGIADCGGDEKGISHNGRLLVPMSCREPRAARPARRRHSGGLARAEPRSRPGRARSEEHTSELQSLMRISYAVFCLKKKKHRA